MTITTDNSEQFVYKYIQLLQGNFGFSDREVEVVALIVHRFKILEAAREKLSPKAREKYDPYSAWREPKSIKDMYTRLGMTFEVFRHNLIRLKAKGVFFEGKINPTLVPPSLNQVTITINNGTTK